MNSKIKLYRPDGGLITNWESWTRPKKDYQWAPGRSAMELAKAWFSESKISIPRELEELFNSLARLKGFQLLRGIPEKVTSLPERGEGRNHDIVLQGKTSEEFFTVCIEAKADEPFGNKTVGSYRAAAIKSRESDIPTRVPERIEKLLSFVPGAQSKWDNIRYQLLTALCGTALQAKSDNSNFAIFVVHEFHTENTIVEKIDSNSRDFEAFLNTIGITQENKFGTLFGPINVAGIDCYVGKIVKQR